MDRRNEYLEHAEDYRQYRDRRDYLRHVPMDELEEAEPVKGHLTVHGRDLGGVVITHVFENGEEQEHHYEPHEFEAACNHLYELIKPDFSESKGESTDEKY